MLLQSLRLSNWRSHHKSSISFSKGSNLIIGGMGTGKSSIVDAICFSLFGNFPMLERKKVKLADVVRKGQEKAELELTFTHKGSSFRVIRSVSGDGKHFASLFVNGRLIEKGVERVSAYISEALSTDYFNFTRAVYSEQNNLPLLLDAVPSKRKEQIDSLLGFERFEEARANISDALKQLNSELSGLRDSFRPEEVKKKEEELSFLSKKEEEINAMICQIEGEAKELRNLVSSARNSDVSVSTALASLRASIKRAYQLRARLEVVEKDISDSSFDEEDMKLLLSLQEQKRELEREEAEYSRKKDNLSKSIAEIEQLERRKEALAKEIGGKKRLEEECSKKKDIIAMLKDVEEAEALFAQLKQKLSDTENTLGILSSASSDCPVCRRPLTKEHAAELIKEHSYIKERLASQLDSLEAKIRQKGELKARLSFIERAEVTLLHIKEKEKEIEEISKRSSEKKALFDALSSLSFDSRRKEEVLVSLRRLEEKKSKSDKVPVLQKEKERIEKELEELEGAEAKLQQKEKELADIRAQIEQYIKALSEKEVLLSERKREYYEIKDRALQLSSELKRAKELEFRISKLAHAISQLEILKAVVEESQAEMRMAVIDALNTAISHIWRVIYPYSNYEAVRIGISDRGYEFEVLYESEWHDIDRLMSGGERTALALAFRIALASVILPDINILILDEPTHNLDRDSVLALSELIQHRLPELVEQSFIITHDENLISADTGKYLKLSRDKDKDAPTEIEEL
ncbi:MAG: AAA family ATPase [Candidatus Anstonellales archaeon]